MSNHTTTSRIKHWLARHALTIALWAAAAAITTYGVLLATEAARPEIGTPLTVERTEIRWCLQQDDETDPATYPCILTGWDGTTYILAETDR